MARRVPRAPPPLSAAASASMRGNKRADTRPEMIVRRLLHRLGYRYRTHVKELPGRPDLVFSRRRIVVQVHGCFWHQHPDPRCPLRSRPKGNADYWRAKLDRNVERDAEQAREIAERGWTTVIVWECDCLDEVQLSRDLIAKLGRPKSFKPATRALD